LPVFLCDQNCSPLKPTRSAKKEYGKHDKRYERSAEVNSWIGNPSKEKKRLGWEPRTRFKDLVRLMVDAAASIVQLVEQLICNQQVIGSSPIAGFGRKRCCSTELQEHSRSESRRENVHCSRFLILI
jgi:hypothetical protein